MTNYALNITHEGALSIALVAAMLLLLVMGWYMSECRCDHCAFHKHERRVNAEKKRLAGVEAEKRQAELAHNMAHKGQGFKDSDPDRFNCSDEQCRRNKEST